MEARSHRIVIVGGGAGGLELAAHLAKAGQEDILLVDQSQTHVWKPRLHELAAGLRRGHVDELDYTGIAEHWGFAFEQGELRDIEPSSKTITLAPIEDARGQALVPERPIRYQAKVKRTTRLAVANAIALHYVWSSQRSLYEHAAIADRV